MPELRNYARVQRESCLKKIEKNWALVPGWGEAKRKTQLVIPSFTFEISHVQTHWGQKFHKNQKSKRRTQLLRSSCENPLVTCVVFATYIISAQVKHMCLRPTPVLGQDKRKTWIMGENIEFFYPRHLKSICWGYIWRLQTFLESWLKRASRVTDTPRRVIFQMCEMDVSSLLQQEH